MAIERQLYDPTRVGKIYENIKMYYELGDPIDYDISVDTLKVVRRTNKPELFYLFENFVTRDTRVVEINLYAGNSNNNQKWLFTFSDDQQGEKGLSGVELETKIQEGVKRRTEEWQHQQLYQENLDLKDQVEELEKEVEELERKYDELEKSQSPLKGILGELGSSFVESFIRRNPGLIKSIPGGAALAGVVGVDNNRKEADEFETEVSFQPKGAGMLAEEDQAAITFVNQLKSKFSQSEFEKILEILQMLSDHKNRIDAILNEHKINES